MISSKVNGMIIQVDVGVIMNRYLKDNTIRKDFETMYYGFDEKSKYITQKDWKIEDELDMMIKIHQEYQKNSWRFSNEELWIGMILKLEEYIEFLEDEIYGVDTTNSVSNNEGFKEGELDNIFKELGLK